MKKMKNVIIGFGKGGKTLAKEFAQRKEEVLVIEQSNQMYGGTCINIGCLPSKSLILSGEKGVPFHNAISKKNEMTSMLRNKNFHMIADEPTAEVWNGQATFIANHQLQVAMADGTSQTIEAERIFVNTGAETAIPKVEGLALSEKIVTSKEIMDLTTLPKRLVIIGAGYIGLEFASMFTSFGSEVTVIDGFSTFIPREDDDISAMIFQDLQEQGITFEMSSQLTKVIENEAGVEVFYKNTADRQVTADVVLVATGRIPHTKGLGLENTNIQLADNGAIVVDETLQTTVENVWAIGDVKGGLQFTYISLDDYRIISSQIFGSNERTTTNRSLVPYSVFLTPPLANVGLTEKRAKETGQPYRVFKLPVANIPKARVIGETRGLYKVVVQPETNKILGASLYGAEAHELINIVVLAMELGADYRILRDGIYTHPTMAEAFNDLLKG